MRATTTASATASTRSCGFKFASPFAIKWGDSVVSFSHYPWSTEDDGWADASERAARPRPHPQQRLHASRFVPFLAQHVNLSVRQTRVPPGPPGHACSPRCWTGATRLTTAHRPALTLRRSRASRLTLLTRDSSPHDGGPRDRLRELRLRGLRRSTVGRFGRRPFPMRSAQATGTGSPPTRALAGNDGSPPPAFQTGRAGCGRRLPDVYHRSEGYQTKAGEVQRLAACPQRLSTRSRLHRLAGPPPAAAAWAVTRWRQQLKRRLVAVTLEDPAPVVATIGALGHCTFTTSAVGTRRVSSLIRAYRGHEGVAGGR